MRAQKGQLVVATFFNGSELFLDKCQVDCLSQAAVDKVYEGKMAEGIFAAVTFLN